MYNEILSLTKELVSINSINGTSGEKNIACFIEDYLRKIQYFINKPSNVFIQKLKNDPLDRRNVFALIEGEKGNSKKTIILHGHIDTVGVDDFGRLKEYAFNCDELMKKFRTMDLEKDVKRDLESGEWLFGRGTCDMKSGVAVFLVIMKYFSENVKELEGNILLSINPVEENLHTGIIEAGKILYRLKNKGGLEYVLAINNDYICPLYPEDNTKYIYTGAVGKLLPCFYIQGKETHVGQCFEGFDASMVASELVRIINLNPKFCEGYNNEYTLPPSVLKMKDLKESYNVQTSYSSFVYFNYFVHNDLINNIIDKLKGAARKALDNVMLDINNKYKEYCKLVGIEYNKINYKTKVLKYEELYNEAKKIVNFDLDENISKLTDSLIKEKIDKREIPLKIVQYICEVSNLKNPIIVLFFAAPYCPHNTLKKEVEEEKKIYVEIEEISKEFSFGKKEAFKVMQFFPSLSDSSYLKVDDDDESIDKLISNFPQYEKLYNVPLKEIKNLNIPAINYGGYGKDAHKWTERVYMPYTFEVLPKLIIKTVKKYI